MTRLWEPRGYEGVISAKSLFSEPRNRITIDPYKVDEVHSAIVQIIIGAYADDGIGMIDVQHLVDAVHPFEVEKPDGY